jgi:hypothetical protein
MAHFYEYAVVVEWQTRYLEGVVGVCSWRFESSQPHHTRGRGSVVEHRLAKARVVGSNPIVRSKFAPLAQLDRAFDYESKGREFESLRARHYTISNGM